MGVPRPYYRTVRQFTDGSYYGNGQHDYIEHPAYSTTPENYIRAFRLLQNDVITLFESVEPADQNLPTYSFRIHELLMRTCIELEANFKAILAANTYSRTGNLNLTDYYKINTSHYLSEYEVQFPYWTGTRSVWKPFEPWRNPVNPATPHVLPWYQAYNVAKHDRAAALPQASLENLLYSLAGLMVVLSAQYFWNDFGPSISFISTNSGGFMTGLSGYLGVKFPTNIPLADRYDFAWSTLSSSAAPFDKFDYDQV